MARTSPPVTPDGRYIVVRGRLMDDVWRWCEARRAFRRTVTIKVEYGDFRQINRRRSRPGAVTTRADLHRSALRLVRSVLPLAKGIRLVGVIVSSFAEPSVSVDIGLPIFAEREAT